MIKTSNILKAALLIAAMATAQQASADNNSSHAVATEATFMSRESNACGLYYKPSLGFVGDPMPFYDPVAGNFKILYLYDARDGSPLYHPIYELQTTNAVFYKNHGETIPCGSIDSDEPAIGTGSTIYADGKYYTYYTGHKGTSPREVILRAVSDDCVSWTKDTAFRLLAPEGYNQDEFRDPYVFYDEDAGLYRMVIATLRDGRSVLAQFTSPDLDSWTLAEPFFINKWERFYECPDIFKMGDWWYLVYSDKDVTRQVQYFYARTLSELMSMGDDPAFPWRDEGKLEGTSFYAGKTASDGTNRYIWGWCATREGNLNEGTQHWAGSLVAHKLVQNADGTLGFACPDGIKAWLGSPVRLKELSRSEGVEGSATEGSYSLSAGQSVRFDRLCGQNRVEFDVTVDNPKTAVFGLSLVDCSDRDYNYRVYIEDRWNMLKFDRVGSNDEGGEERTNINAFSLIAPDDGKYHVTMVSDESTCVVYINNQYAFTNRVYGMQNNPWSLFCSDGNVKISNLQVAQSGTASTVLWDGEEQAIGSQGGWWGDCSPEVVANPDADGINKSAKCMMFSVTGNDNKIAKIPFRDWTKPAMGGRSRISMMVRKSVGGFMQVELSDPTNGAEGYWKKVAAEVEGDGEWHKVVFDFMGSIASDCPGVMSITSQAGADATTEELVYIDNVAIEPLPMVDGVPLGELDDNSIEGHVRLSGAWMSGKCHEAEQLTELEYDDFKTLAAKLTAGATSVDMRGTALKDAHNAFAGTNPNILVYADEDVEGDNVIVDRRAHKVVLSDEHAFNVPGADGFDADRVVINRKLYKGYNTVYLPFYVSAGDMSAEQLATFDGISTNEEGAPVAGFSLTDHVEANTPVLAYIENEADSIVFMNKYIAEVNRSVLPSGFVGVYAPQSAEGLWGIADNNKFRRGGAGARIGAFRAYLEGIPDGASTLAFKVAPAATDDIQSAIATDDQGTTVDVCTISGLRIRHDVPRATATRGLPKGIYIIGGRKIAVR